MGYSQSTLAQHGIMVKFLPTSLHHQNLVERLHLTLQSIIRAVRQEGVSRWGKALSLATRFYNQAIHHATGFAPVYLHLNEQRDHPGQLHPEGHEACPVSYKDAGAMMREDEYIIRMLRSVMQINHEENVRKTARYYKGHAKDFPVGALVWWNQTCTDKKDGDQIPNKKLKLSWSGPYIFQGVINDTMGKIEQQRNRQPTGKVRNVHLSQLRLYLRPEQYENELERPARRPEIRKPTELRTLKCTGTSEGKCLMLTHGHQMKLGGQLSPDRRPPPAETGPYRRPAERKLGH